MLAAAISVTTPPRADVAAAHHFPSASTVLVATATAATTGTCPKSAGDNAIGSSVVSASTKNFADAVVVQPISASTALFLKVGVGATAKRVILIFAESQVVSLGSIVSLAIYFTAQNAT